VQTIEQAMAEKYLSTLPDNVPQGRSAGDAFVADNEPQPSSLISWHHEMNGQALPPNY
jgi:hypothetical protein